MILAGDIGGTKTNLALFSFQEGEYHIQQLATFSSQAHTNLESIVHEFLRDLKGELPAVASFAIAGPVINGVCKTTNLPWVVDTRELEKSLKISPVFLLNDLEANAWALEILPDSSFFTLSNGAPFAKGNRAVISPGTGLGEAGLYWDGMHYHPFACEGGHAEFGPRGELQLKLSRYLQKKFGHPSYERVLSGPGLHELYLFLKEEGREERNWLKEALTQDDPSKIITQHALDQTAEICVEALDLFVSILGSEAANCALKFMATGGMYLGGGIPPKILPKLQESVFFEGFLDKGRFKSLLEMIPVKVILDDKASLKGAAHFCLNKIPIKIK